ncbi:DUF421 domain-containing protein [Archangium violaceum]|uniref:DUF421 domain-containing protein n=1 Tax=Archangium violaceum TaxID=83451 RepID=UPI002B2E12F5|nr:DUF421 domain-containing protein [Archangium violaceum]
MHLIGRAVAIYVLLMVLFQIAGKRSVSQMNTFDLVLLLIISEATQQALLGEDHSLTGAAIVIVTMVGLNILLSWVRYRFQRVEMWLNEGPVILVDDGRLVQNRMRKTRVDEADILLAAREKHGLERLEQIKYAILESSGSISIIPR